MQEFAQTGLEQGLLLVIFLLIIGFIIVISKNSFNRKRDLKDIQEFLLSLNDKTDDETGNEKKLEVNIQNIKQAIVTLNGIKLSLHEELLSVKTDFDFTKTNLKSTEEKLESSQLEIKKCVLFMKVLNIQALFNKVEDFATTLVNSNQDIDTQEYSLAGKIDKIKKQMDETN